MVAQTRCATQEELQLLLMDEETATNSKYWTEHVATCPRCHDALTAIAAPDELWQESREHFSIDEGEWEPKAESSVPDFTLAHYRIEGVVGYGGMATVYRGFDPQLHRAVAIKVLHPHLAKAGNSRQRFLREAQSAAGITHPNVIPIFGVHHQDGKTYLVMPLIANGSLQNRIDCDGPLCLEDTLRIGLQIAEALAAAHANGVIHRDVKPANILLEDGNKRVVLSDFGLARTLDDASITASGMIAGTPAYMSPEQARGESVDFRTDLFSLGSVLYAMCTGHSPFQASSTLKLLREVSDSSVQSVHRYQEQLPMWVDRLIARFTAADPSRRISDASQGAELIRNCLLHVTNPKNPLPEELKKTKRTWTGSRPRTRIAVSVIAMMALVGALAGFTSLFWPMQNGTTPQNNLGDRGQRVSSPPSWHDTLAIEILQISNDLDQFARLANLPPFTHSSSHLGDATNDNKKTHE